MAFEFLPVLIFVAAFLIGAAVAALFLKQRHQLSLANALAAKEAEKTQEFCVASEKIAAAEARLARIPELEKSLTEREKLLEDLRAENSQLGNRLSSVETQLIEERKAAGEKLALVENAQAKLSDAFQSLSAQALRSNNQSFLELAKATLEKFQDVAKGDLEKRQTAIDQLVKPVRESLDKVDAKIQEIEKSRTGAYESLLTQVKTLADTQNLLRSETANLVKALRSPIVRGRWGEIQLRRVVEMAGMLDHCDFYEQESVTTVDGRLRPDLLVRLPGEKTVVVDAKAPLSAYLEAIESKDEEERVAKLTLHAAQVRAHIDALTRKAYWEQFRPAPEFVVLFLPGETFFSAALERDPSLIEFGADKRVILATPTTLIALLRAVFYGWRQQKLAQNAHEISELGRELFKRVSDMGGHLMNLGERLNKSVESYNKTIGTLESRVMVTARKFKELEAAPAGAEIEPLLPVEQIARQIQAPELVLADAERKALDALIKDEE